MSFLTIIAVLIIGIVILTIGFVTKKKWLLVLKPKKTNLVNTWGLFPWFQDEKGLIHPDDLYKFQEQNSTVFFVEESRINT